MGNENFPTPLPSDKERPTSAVREEDLGFNTVPEEDDLQAALLPDTLEHEFRIVLRGISLDDAQQKAIQDAMKEAMLAGLADLDFNGDLRASEPVDLAGGPLKGKVTTIEPSP